MYTFKLLNCYSGSVSVAVCTTLLILNYGLLFSICLIVNMSAHKPKDGIPFKTKIGDISCIATLNQNSLDLCFDAVADHKRCILYSDIRCIQYQKSTVLINTSQNGRLFSYVMTISGAKRLCMLLVERCNTANNPACRLPFPE